MSLDALSDATWFKYLWVVGLLFVGGSLVRAGLLGSRRGSQASTAWVQTTAKILRTGAGRSANGYVPEVWYRYTIDGIEYESAQLRVFERLSSEGSALKDARRYQATQEVTAFVNPENHAESYLEPSAQPAAAGFFVFIGLVFVAIAVWLLIAILRSGSAPAA